MLDDHLDESIFGTSRTAQRLRPDAHRVPPDPRTDPLSRRPGGLSGRSTQDRRRRRDRRRRTGVRWLVLLLTLVLVAGAGWVALGYLRPVVAGITAGDDYTGGGAGSTLVVVHKGDSGRTIGTALQGAGVVKSAGVFTDALAGRDAGVQIQPGRYRLHLRMSAAAALGMLLNPRNRFVPHLTVREGLWRTEIFAALARATGTPVADYAAAARRPAQIDLPPAARGNVEGYLFPATYEFDVGATASEQLRTMVDKARAELTALRVPSGDMQRVLIVASIVQAEARRPADFAKVSRVVYNRLAARQKLQLDSTVSYAAHRRSVTTTDAERASRSPYNTYQVPGLPAAPIGNPGVAALQAALHPAKGAWRYFVAVNPVTGETRFAVTAAGHAVNEQVFHRWCAAHPGKC